MNDTQILTLVLGIVIPISLSLSAVIYSNSRVTDVKTSILEAKETLRAEMKTAHTETRAEAREQFNEIKLILVQLQNTINHLADTVARHDDKLS